MSRVIYESEKRITCGWQGYAGHNGVDLGWRYDETKNEVYSNCVGKVIEVKDGLDTLPISAKSWGNYVLVEHPNGMRSRYAHLRKGTIRVAVGQEVDGNTCIAIMGESGSVNGRHLHFEVYDIYGNRIDPTPYLTTQVYEEPKKEQLKDTEKEELIKQIENLNMELKETKKYKFKYTCEKSGTYEIELKDSEVLYIK